MATVTGLTAARMAEIEAASIVDGEVVGDNLILTKHDTSTINAGNVRGPAGTDGIDGAPGPEGPEGPAGPSGESGLLLSVVSADVSTSNNGSPIDTGMEITLDDSGIYEAEAWVLVEAANTVMDFRFYLTLPAGATAKWGGIPGTTTVIGWATLGAGSTPTPLLSDATSNSCGAGNSVSGFPYHFIIFCGGTSGVAKLRFSQSSIDAGTLTLKRGSYWKARKILN